MKGVNFSEEIPVAHRHALRDVVMHHFIIDELVRVSATEKGYMLSVPDKRGHMMKHAEIVRSTGEICLLNRKGKVICTYTIPIIAEVLGGLK